MWDGRGGDAGKGDSWKDSGSNGQPDMDVDSADSDSLSDLSYIDSHCHLDSCIQNERFGPSIWTLKKWLCIHWQKGHCWYGDDCNYAHGEEGMFRLPALQPADLEAFATRHPTRWQRAGGGPRLGWLITNCCEGEAIADTMTLVSAGERLLDGRVLCTFGCHPHMYEDYGDELEAKLLQAVERCGRKVVAWGECGLDYYKNHYEAQWPENRARMVAVFARQARMAAWLGLPLVVHTRDAEEDTMAVLTSALPREHPMHIHAFQGSTAMLEEIFRLLPNAVVGVSGAIFGVADAQRVARHVPLDRIVLETDAPYLSDEPRDVPSIARATARLKGGVSAREVLEASSRNSERVYGLREVGRAGAVR